MMRFENAYLQVSHRLDLYSEYLLNPSPLRSSNPSDRASFFKVPVIAG